MTDIIRTHAARARRALRGAALVALGALSLAACGEDIEDPFVVEGTGNISGLLFFDAGRDGFFEPVEGDSALAGIPIALRVRGTDQILANTTTSATGNFSFSDIQVGTHDLVFDIDDDVAVVCLNPQPVSVRPSEVTAITVVGQESCLIPIEEAREKDIGTLVTVRGVVTVGSGDLSGSYFFIQDETAGVKVFATANAQVGDYVEVTGAMDLFSGEVEIGGGAQITTLSTGQPLPDPIEVTGAEFLSAETQGSLVVVRGVQVTGVPDLAGQTGTSYNVNVVAPGTEPVAQRSFIIRVDSDVGITPGTFVVGQTYDVTGVSSPFGGAEQLYVRSNADIDQI